MGFDFSLDNFSVDEEPSMQVTVEENGVNEEIRLESDAPLDESSDEANVVPSLQVSPAHELTIVELTFTV